MSGSDRFLPHVYAINMKSSRVEIWYRNRHKWDLRMAPHTPGDLPNRRHPLSRAGNGGGEAHGG